MPMSDEEAQEFEEENPRLASVGALVGRFLGQAVALTKLGCVMLLIAGSGLGLAQLGSVALVGGAFGTALITHNALFEGCSGIQASAYPKVTHALAIVLYTSFYGVAAGIGLDITGSAYWNVIYYVSAGSGLLSAFALLIAFESDALLHDRLFGEVSS